MNCQHVSYVATAIRYNLQTCQCECLIIFGHSVFQMQVFIVLPPLNVSCLKFFLQSFQVFYWQFGAISTKENKLNKLTYQTAVALWIQSPSEYK